MECVVVLGVGCDAALRRARERAAQAAAARRHRGRVHRHHQGACVGACIGACVHVAVRVGVRVCVRLAACSRSALVCECVLVRLAERTHALVSVCVHMCARSATVLSPCVCEQACVSLHTLVRWRPCVMAFPYYRYLCRLHAACCRLQEEEDRPEPTLPAGPPLPTAAKPRIAGGADILGGDLLGGDLIGTVATTAGATPHSCHRRDATCHQMQRATYHVRTRCNVPHTTGVRTRCIVPHTTVVCTRCNVPHTTVVRTGCNVPRTTVVRTRCSIQHAAAHP